MQYIIKVILTQPGNTETLYHEKLELSKNKSATNVYVQHLTSDKKKALIFYDKEEADKMAVFVTDSFLKASVIKK
jgi:hypothetical protein